MTEVERDYSSVYSRLMLCKTYRLDEDGKVLTPEEVNIYFILLNMIFRAFIYNVWTNNLYLQYNCLIKNI